MAEVPPVPDLPPTLLPASGEALILVTEELEQAISETRVTAQVIRPAIFI